MNFMRGLWLFDQTLSPLDLVLLEVPSGKPSSRPGSGCGCGQLVLETRDTCMLRLLGSHLSFQLPGIVVKKHLDNPVILPAEISMDPECHELASVAPLGREDCPGIAPDGGFLMDIPP